jgi:hypothetical protein
MRFLLVAALMLVVFLFAAVMAVRVIISLSFDNVRLPVPGGTNASSSGNATFPPSSSVPVFPSASSTFIPSGFHGPSSPPKIIGPTGNPPNY